MVLYILLCIPRPLEITCFPYIGIHTSVNSPCEEHGENQVRGLWFWPWCPKEIRQVPLYCLPWWCRQQPHRVLAIQAVGPQQLQWHHWWLTQTVSDACVMAKPLTAELCRRHHAWCGGYLLPHCSRCCMAWGKFIKFLLVLTNRYFLR